MLHPIEDCIEHIKTISTLFNDQPLYVHLLTNSASKVNYYKQTINKPNISFGYKERKLVLSKNHITLGLPTQYDERFDGPPREKEDIFYPAMAFPLKFPPHSFFIEQVINLSTMFNDAPLYVHLFTDDPQPLKLLNRYKTLINKPNIIYGCQEYNNHDQEALQDLFALTQFDCLISGESNFSILASKISDYRVIIYPTDFRQSQIIKKE